MVKLTKIEMIDNDYNLDIGGDIIKMIDEDYTYVDICDVINKKLAELRIPVRINPPNITAFRKKIDREGKKVLKEVVEKKYEEATPEKDPVRFLTKNLATEIANMEVSEMKQIKIAQSQIWDSIIKARMEDPPNIPEIRKQLNLLSKFIDLGLKGRSVINSGNQVDCAKIIQSIIREMMKYVDPDKMTKIIRYINVEHGTIIDKEEKDIRFGEE